MSRPLARSAAALGAAALLLSGFAGAPASAAVSPQRDLGRVDINVYDTATLTNVAVDDQFEIANRATNSAHVIPGTGLARNNNGKVCDTPTACSLPAATPGPITVPVFYVQRPGTITIQYTDGKTSTIDLQAAATLPTPVPAVTNWNPSTLEARFDWTYDWTGFTPASFTVQKQLSGGAWETIPNAAWPLQTYALATVLPGQTWNFRVKAIAQDGTESAWGDTTYTVPALSLPLTITAGDASGTFTWDKLPATTLYKIYAYSGTQFQPTVDVTCSTAPCSYAMTGLTNGTTYTGYIKAMDPGNTGREIAQSSDVKFTPAVPTLPKPSVSLLWFGDTGTRASLDFAPYNWGTFTPQRFEIRWTTDGESTWNAVDNSATPLKEQNVYIDGVGPAGQPVAFDVRAIAADGSTSEYGRVGSVVPQPFTVTATAGNQSISGSFTAYPRPGTQYTVVLATATDPFLKTITLGAAGPFTFTGLTNGTEYTVYAFPNAISGATSNKVTLKPEDKKLSQPNPAATWDPAKGSIVTWPWTDADWGTTGKGNFQVTYVDDSKTTTLTTAKATITIGAGVLRRNVAHVISVVAIGGDGTKSNAGQTSITPPFTDTVLSAAAGDGSITATFPWVAGATSMSLGLKPDGGATTYTTVPCTSAGACTKTFTGLMNGTTYRVWISAIYDASGRVIGYGNDAHVTPRALPQPLDLVYPVKADLHVGQPTVISPTAAGGTTPYAFKQGSTPLPKGLTLNAATGVISGTPEVAVDGLYPIVISDQSGQSLTAPLRLVIAAHTLTVSYPDHAGHVGMAFTMTPSVSHALGSVSYALAKGTLPAGMTFDKATGEISGTPTAATSGPVALEVKATDTYASSTAAFTITVDSGTAKLSASYPNATGHVGKPQAIAPTISGATGATSFALATGTLPAGLTLDPATGLITGTPTAEQAATPVTVRVTDTVASVDVTFTIAELAHTLTVAYPSSTGDVGAATTISPVVSHTLGTVTYALTSGALPSGLTLDPATGVITGTPTQVTTGAVALTVTATDGYGSAAAPFTITVTDVTPPAPTIGATMTRDVDRVAASGTVVGAAAGTTITPWYRFPGDTGYTAGVPVTLDANGGFTWQRQVNRSKTIRVYFTVSGVQSTTLVGQAPKVEVTGSRSGTSLLVTGTTTNIASGSTVHPWIKVDGGKAQRGIPLQVGADGTFAWTYIAGKGQQVRVKFNVRGVKSDPIVL